MKFSESADLKPYPSYKTSSIPWTGEIPAHWEISHLRYFCECLDGKRIPLSAENREAKQGRIPYWGANSVIDHINEWIFDEPLVLVGEDGAPFNDRTRSVAFFVNEKVWVNNHIHVLRCRKELRPEFLVHILNSVDYNNFISGSTRDKLTQQKLLDIPIQLAPATEQTAIVQYLDEADQQIQAYISAKERLIALLEEQRQAIIHQAVTRGLDPNVRLKPSGVEWLGDVPEHWEVMPLKRAFVSMDYGISDSGSQTGGVRLLTMGNIRDGSVTVPSTGGVTAIDQSLLLEKNDLLFNRTNSAELVAKVGLFSGHDSPVTFASYLVRMRSRSSNEPEYLNMALNETTFLAQARREAVPSLHQSNLNPTRYGRIHISLPPKEEQKTILSALAEKTNGLTTSMELAHRQIELIEEYRTRLIADVVTGKLDVRKAAEELPQLELTEITD